MITSKIIKEELENDKCAGESRIRRGVYLMSDGSYEWMTFTKSGNCKKLSTAMKKAGF